MKRTHNDLKIDLVQDKNRKNHPPVPHPNVMPAHEFGMLVVAPKGSGKTNLLANLILKHYKGYFHRIIVCSPTIHNDDKWQIVRRHKNILKENKSKEALGKPTAKKNFPTVVHKKNIETGEEIKFDGKIPEEDFMESMDDLYPILAEQHKEIASIGKKLEEPGNAKYEADRMLIILDDQAGNYPAGNYNNPMVNYVIKHRHYSSSFIVVTQAYTGIPSKIRKNCNALVMFEIPNEAELKTIYGEKPCNNSYENWTKLYNHATHEPYSFWYSNDMFPKGKRIFKRFETLLSLQDDDSEDEKVKDAEEETKK